MSLLYKSFPYHGVIITEDPIWSKVVSFHWPHGCSFKRLFKLTATKKQRRLITSPLSGSIEYQWIANTWDQQCRQRIHAMTPSWGMATFTYQFTRCCSVIYMHPYWWAAFGLSNGLGPVWWWPNNYLDQRHISVNATRFIDNSTLSSTAC